jgi:hypothetical protein
MKNGKYFIVLFCNKKRVKILHRSMTKNTIYEYWREFRTQKKPRYVKQQGSTGSKRKTELIYELALVFPKTRWSTSTYVKDSLGRNMEATMEDDKFRIKEIIPYWKEELIYDFQTKKRIRYHEMLNKILPITEIAQVFLLNNKLFVQVEEDIKLYGNKNINDSDRLFELVKEDLIKKKKGNFIFVKDITTYQRTLLYNLLESKGFKRSELFRHYSY